MSQFDLCVVGMGYIGLPTSVLFAQAGLKVLGTDVDKHKVDQLSKGECTIHEIGLPERLSAVIASGNLQVSQTPAVAAAYLLCVPTPVTEDRKADLSFVEAATRTIAPILKKGDLVILESTVPPRTCSDLVVPILHEITGMDPKNDYLLVHAPERVIPGAIFKELTENVRIVGGVTPAAADAAESLYRRAGVKDIRKTSAEVAEMAKVAENTFRDVNIALANEFAAICRHLDVDVFETIALANLHPRVNIHTPGIGVGGHCIPVDPWFLIHLAPEQTKLLRTARSINDSRPREVVDDILSKHGKRNINPIGILGVAYKPDVDDVRESPALEVVHLLMQTRRQLYIYDPFCPSHSNSNLETVLNADTVAVLQEHSQFRDIQGPNILRWNRTTH